MNTATPLIPGAHCCCCSLSEWRLQGRRFAPVNFRFWPVGDREGQSRSPTGVTLDLRLFRDLQCVVDVDAEVPDSAF
jgi:hypothetical protein